MTWDEDEIAQARAQLAHWGEPALNSLDALMWRTEDPPGNSWAGVVVLLLESTPTWDRVVAAHHWGVGLVPRFTEKVVEPIVPTGPPRWTPDDDFDLAYHLRRTSLPGPGTMQQLLELAQVHAVTPLDRNRPPWSALFVEGLEDGRSAYLLQAHHVLMDGAAATQLFSRVLDHSALPARPAPRSTKTLAVADSGPLARPVESRRSVTTKGLRWQVAGAVGLAKEAARALQAAAAHPSHAVRESSAFAPSLLRVATPPPPAVSDLLRPGPRSKWRFGQFECHVGEIKAASRTVGGTVNDAFVAAILGGLRKYHQRHGSELGDIPISMPVSVRRDDDPLGGNRFTGAFFQAPASVEDAADRIVAMHGRVQAVRAEPALDFLGQVTPVMNLLPKAVVGGAIRALNAGATLTTSSWLGVPFPVWFAGARVQRMWVFGPLPGTSMCAALCTHESTCCIGVNVDGDVFPDVDALWECLQEGLDEVIALGR